MNPIFIIILIMLLFGGVVGVILFFTIKKLDPYGGDKTEDPNIQTTQEFWPFEDIRDDTIILSEHKYRAVIECSATNYNLKTQAERALIEASFQRFLNSISFPFTFYLPTKEIDNGKRLKMLHEDIKSTLIEFPNMTQYAEQYERDMSELNTKIGNSQQKKRYIIVPYDDVTLLDNLNEEEKAGYAAKELRSRCNIIISNLEAVGVVSHILNNEELFEYLYACDHRDNYAYSEALASKEAFATFVHGEHDVFRDMPKAASLDIILSETINKMELGNFSQDHDSVMVLKELKDMREKYAGYYKQKKEEGGSF